MLSNLYFFPHKRDDKFLCQVRRLILEAISQLVHDRLAATMSATKVGSMQPPPQPNLLSEIQAVFRPWVFTHLCCFLAFATQMGIISQEYISPTQTVVNSRIEKLHTMDQLPVLFKVCMDVGVEEEKLKELG